MSPSSPLQGPPSLLPLNIVYLSLVFHPVFVGNERIINYRIPQAEPVALCSYIEPVYTIVLGGVVRISYPTTKYLPPASQDQPGFLFFPLKLLPLKLAVLHQRPSQ